MKKILLILTGSIFVVSAYAQGNGNGNGNGNIPTEHNEGLLPNCRPRWPQENSVLLS
jgi:hypothetical protein